MSQQTVTDARFGEIFLTTDREQGRFGVSGAEIPETFIRRDLDLLAAKAAAPIGTRTPEVLSVTVDGLPAVLELGPGGLTRRSYRARVTAGETGYELTPNTPETSLLVRYPDRTPMGEITVLEEGPRAEWAEEADATGAAIGYTLALAFGVGANHPLHVIIDSAILGGY